MVLVDIYQDAAERPFTYLFINLTQECDTEVKCLSNLFDGALSVYINKGRSFAKYIASGTFENITITPASIPRNITLVPFKPFGAQMLYENNVYPSQQSQSQNVYLQLQSKCAKAKM